jgi:uncharacterized surface protein with fasciclin (FAS1) repeats
MKGSIYEVLEKQGNYSIFLKGVELANMKRILNGKSILTVMAPSDPAFTTFLNENYGGKKIEELPKEEISKIIGFHILYYTFDKNKLINFRPLEGDGATEEEKNINAGMFYKFRTKSMDKITIEKDTAGNDVSVYHLERFLPIFSYRMFQTKQIDAKSNYEYFFPNTSWKHNDGFNVSNAAVNEFAIIAHNGYVYTIDQVLRPLETIYKELASNEDYSDFLELYNAYDYYQLDANLTLEYGNGTNLYQHYHSSPLANIACEWPVTDYRMVAPLSAISYSVFAPNNSAFHSFFDDYWRVGGYTSLDEVSKTSIEYLLFNCVYTSSIVFPEEIKKGLIKNYFGTTIKFDTDAVLKENRKMCSNGALYGLSVLTPPAMFGSVTGPAFQYKKYSYFLDWLSVSDLVLTLCSDQTKYFVLYPSNELMNLYGITKEVNGTFRKGGQAISSVTLQNYVFAHVVSLGGTTGSYQSLPSSGTHVLRTLSPSMYLYWYMKDGKITNCVKYNELLYSPGTTEDDVFSEINELTFRDGWTNGKCYSYQNLAKPYLFEGSQANAIYGSFIPMMLNNRNQSSTIFYGFIQLLEKANLTDVGSQSIIPVVESSLMFVPTTTAIKTGILNGKVPGISTTSTDINDPDFFINCTVSNIDTLQYYMLQYFIPLSTAVISNFPYVGWEETITKGLPTLQSYDVDLGGGKVVTKTTKINVTDANNKISIRVLDNEGNPTGSWIDVIGDYHYFPFVFDDGCVHFIEEVL